MRNFILRPIREHLKDGNFHILDNPYSNNHFCHLFVMRQDATLLWDSAVDYNEISDLLWRKIMPSIELRRFEFHDIDYEESTTATVIFKSGKDVKYQLGYTPEKIEFDSNMMKSDVSFVRFDLALGRSDRFQERSRYPFYGDATPISFTAEKIDSEVTELAFRVPRGMSWSPSLIEIIINSHLDRTTMIDRIDLVEAGSLISTLTGLHAQLITIDR